MVLSVFWQLRFLSILEGFRDRHLDVFGKLWHKNCVFWHACLQVTFFKDFGVRIWTSGAPESSILCGRYCKNQLFTYVGSMSILVSFLHGFQWLWDQFGWLLVAWCQAWNIMIFNCFLGGSRSWATMAIPGYLVHFLGPIASSKKFQHIMNHAGMKGYEKAGYKLRKYEKSKLQYAFITTKNQGCNMLS